MMIKNTGLAAALLGATLFSTAAVAETNWIAPFVLCAAVFILLFVLAAGPYDVPFMYRSAQ